MAEYIEREATIELFRSLGSRDYRREKGTIQDAIKMVSSGEYTPAADVAPVVRCRDCVHWREAVTNDKGFLICPASGMEITESDFCSYGEREENNGVD